MSLQPKMEMMPIDLDPSNISIIAAAYATFGCRPDQNDMYGRPLGCKDDLTVLAFWSGAVMYPAC
jgi:hypothetical protein